MAAWLSLTLSSLVNLLIHMGLKWLFAIRWTHFANNLLLYCEHSVTNFWTCHGSAPVVSCANLRRDCYVVQIVIVMKKQLENVTSVLVNSTIPHTIPRISTTTKSTKLRITTLYKGNLPADFPHQCESIFCATKSINTTPVIIVRELSKYGTSVRNST